MILDSNVKTSSPELETSHMECEDLTPPSQPLPIKITHGKEIYRLQKQIEETLARCRTLAYLTNDVACLKQSLSQCESAMKTLASSATSIRPNEPPIFGAIAKAGVEEFRSTTKTLHRIGTKRKRDEKGKHPTRCEAHNPLQKAVQRGIGRPKVKRTQRKQPPLPRQVNEKSRSRMIKAAALLRKGIKCNPFLHVYMVC